MTVNHALVLAMVFAAAMQSALFGESVQARIKSGSVSDKDYPQDALRNNIEGDADVMFTVDQLGKPRDCRAVAPRSHEILVSASCSVISKWRFRPAEDATGAKVSSQVTQPFSWGLKSSCGRGTSERNRICVTGRRR
jgi:TonB family protein